MTKNIISGSYNSQTDFARALNIYLSSIKGPEDLSVENKKLVALLPKIRSEEEFQSLIDGHYTKAIQIQPTIKYASRIYLPLVKYNFAKKFGQILETQRKTTKGQKNNKELLSTIIKSTEEIFQALKCGN